MARFVADPKSKSEYVQARTCDERQTHYGFSSAGRGFVRQCRLRYAATRDAVISRRDVTSCVTAVDAVVPFRNSSAELAKQRGERARLLMSHQK
mgnify:FL=1|jgi:hypothetical protein